ncbi:MAG: hypothetical protein SPJ02_03430 [Parabacteroides sp.]|nr:hypothetical protein [Parabacteroides sp.]
MKIILSIMLLLAFSCSANAQLFKKTEPKFYAKEYTDAQIEVGQYRPMEKNIKYMLEHSTDGELRNYAKKLNAQEIAEAKAKGEPVPEKLSEETLKSRKKIGEYLRSYIKIPY